MIIKIFLYEGDTDFQGKVWTEDRYIVLDDGCDVYGEHFSKKEAELLLN